MTCQIQYFINDDAQYLVMFETHEFGSDRGARSFFGGKEPVLVARGQPVPDQCIHKITTLQMVQLLDALLAHGIRPSSNAWSSGHMADLKNHIAFAEKVAMTILEKSSG